MYAIVLYLTITCYVIYMKAPDFSLIDQNGKTHTLSGYKGTWVVLYFYPKDDTPGCTKEACAFRDMADEYRKKDITVLGVSKDSPQSHTKFAQKYRLTFPLLSDEGKEIIKAYGAWGVKKFMGRQFEGTLRKTFVIDPAGIIGMEYPKVEVLRHAGEIIRDIDGMKKESL